MVISLSLNTYAKQLKSSHKETNMTKTAAISGLHIRMDVPTKCQLVELVLTKSFSAKKEQNAYIELLASQNFVNPITIKLWCGKYLELDNVIVHPTHRSKGVGKLLTTYLVQKAIDLNCKSVALDAYTHNFSAHKFYYNHGFVPKGFHFVKFLEED